MKLKIFLLLAFIVFPTFVFAQTPRDPRDNVNPSPTVGIAYSEQLAEIDAYAKKIQVDWNVPGFAIGIVKDDKLIFAKGYGVKKLESSPSATYARLYLAVKAKNTEAIKREMSLKTQEFAEGQAKTQNVSVNLVYSNGFTATTFSNTLPQMRDERIKDNFGALEVRSEKEGRWEDLPFVFENGDWKLAFGEVFSVNYKSPGLSFSFRQLQNSNVAVSLPSNKTKGNSNSNSNSAMTNTNSNKLIEPKLIESPFVDENTLFAVASNSKAFTTASLAMLIDEKKLNWDDKVTKYLPEFQMYDAYVTREMTVRDLVSHRSGLDTFSGDLLWYDTNYSADEIIHRVRYLKPVSSFRSRYGYQNPMFIVAAKVIEKVSGKTWGEFVKERILQPLEMKRTTVSIKDFKDNVASPHNESGGGKLRALPHGPMDNAWGACGVNSSVSEMGNWLRMQLNKGKFADKQIVSESQIWQMHQQNMFIPISPAGAKFNPTRHYYGYGLGWFLNDYQGRKVVSHGGGLDGMISQTAMMPEENLGLVVLTNSETSVNTIMQNKIFDVMLNVLPKRDWSAEILQRTNDGKKAEAEENAKIDASQVKNTKPSLSMKDYAGTYTSQMYGDVTISEENGKLILRLKPAPNFVADLEHWHYDTFQIKWRGSVNYNFPRGWVTFTLDKNAKPDQLKIDQPNNDFWFYELELKRTK